jgi:hypothetical protein
MPEGRAKGQQVAAGAYRASQSQVSLRVQQIYAFLRDGQRTSEIYKLCARMREIEQQQRLAWRSGKLDKAGVPVVEPLNVWGETPLPSTRTLDDYIKKAKKQIAEDGRELAKKGEYVLGAQYARILDVYSRALTDKKYHAALRAIEVLNRMFGLEGVVKVQLLPPTEGESAGKTPVQRIAEMTPESAFLELQTIVSRALARAKEKGQLPRETSVEQVLLGNPVKVVEPSTNGDKR